MTIDYSAGSGSGSGPVSHRAEPTGTPKPRRRRGSLLMATTAVVATAIATVAGVTPVVAGAVADASRAITHPHAHSQARPADVQAGRSVPGNLPTVRPGTPVVTAPTKPTQGGTTSSPITTGVKAPMAGLLDRHHAPSSTYKGIINGYVLPVSWASLQTSPGGPLVHPNAIDNAIKYAAANNLTLKLRVESGLGAPNWAKSLDGAPVTVKYTAATKGKEGVPAGTIGRFWTPKFGAAYQDLQNKLAAAYDNVPQIRETDITRCATIFEETYLRNTKLAENATALLKAGFTRALDDVCHNQQIAAHQVWKHTRSDLSFNAYQAIAANGSVKSDLAYTLSQMDYCRAQLGIRCVLSNHSLSSSRITDKAESAIWGKMKAMKDSGPFALQTATAAKIGDWNYAIGWAITNGASSIELPTGYDGWGLTALRSLQGKF